mmetsp:Transcript_32036/g.79199  ORF Transcript_32036/g.79199 Transcript_32036/m.79199 type:complete len:279 (+) Transcript_32036:164-1000(+)
MYKILDDGAVGDDGVLDDDDDAILDDVALVLVVRLLHVVLVDDLAVHADARVLVHDGAADVGAGSDADGDAPRERLALGVGFVVVGAHDHGVFDDAPVLDVGAQADHGVREGALGDKAPVADGAQGHHAVHQFAGGQEARHGVDGPRMVVEGKPRLLRVVAHEVGVVECLDGPDVLPVPVEEERLHVHAEVLGGGDHLTSEVVGVGEVGGEQLLHGIPAEDVDAHGGDVRHLLSALRVQAQDGGVHLHGLERGPLGLLRELDDPPVLIYLHEPEVRGT